MNDEIGTEKRSMTTSGTFPIRKKDEKSGRKTVPSTAENIPAVITTNVLVPWEVSGH